APVSPRSRARRGFALPRSQTGSGRSAERGKIGGTPHRRRRASLDCRSLRLLAGLPPAAAKRPDPAAPGRYRRESPAAAARPHRRPPPAAPAPPDRLPLGSPAPAFELPDLSGERRSLAQFLGQRLLLIFFSPSCGFCVKMLPDLARLSADGKDGRPLPLLVTT